MKRMQKYLPLLILFILFIGASFNVRAQSGQELLEICTMDITDITYLKDFQVKLDAAQPGEEKPVMRKTFMLKKGNQYRFKICNSKDYTGEAILQVYDSNRLMGTTYNVATGKSYDSIDIKCTKTGPYHIFISYKEGEPGLSVAILYHVKVL